MVNPVKSTNTMKIVIGTISGILSTIIVFDNWNPLAPKRKPKYIHDNSRQYVVTSRDISIA